MAWSLPKTLLYVISFSAGYAYFELHGDPCSILPWCGYYWQGITLYQYGFMLPLFTFVALVPFLRDIPWDGPADIKAFACFLVAIVTEDFLYFVFENRPIPSGVYTTQWGYLQVGTIALPYW